MREMKTPSARSMPLPSRMYSPSVWPGRLTISTKCTEYLGSCKRKQNIGITPRKQTVQPIATLMIPDQHREPARYKTPTFSFLDLLICTSADASEVSIKQPSTGCHLYLGCTCESNHHAENDPARATTVWQSSSPMPTNV